MYSPFNNRNVSKLCLQRHGWVKPEYELKDDLYSYGKLTFKTVSLKNRGMAELADAVLNFKFTDTWKRAISVTDANENVIGTLKSKLFSFASIFTLADSTQYILKRKSFWKACYEWESIDGGRLMTINLKPFANTDEVFIEQSTSPLHLFPLLTFTAFYLIISRQRQAAAAGA
ncbi:hypothetical protein LT679_03805 [Mucilaginibacter roseus]|uniref:Uncharacterized protein n=1 Tax=Mucilaginibacter roseus TaxID=1528868 RepID=A0ABS8U2G8_9SPHI|nr:hypothetical protein [Mucilaginibacter roseus]MCD8739718.1 hypothetical protein [Mucilaginibacter roseus]